MNYDQHIRDWHRSCHRDRHNFLGGGLWPVYLEAWVTWHLRWLILDKRYLWSLNNG